MTDIESIIKKQKSNRVKWGFIWAIICAVLWGLGYIPLTVFWGVSPFADPEVDYIAASVLISAFQSIVFGIVLALIWVSVNGKIREVGKTVKKLAVSKWLFTGAIFGGPMALLGTALAIGYIGGAFAASFTLLCAVVGTVLGRLVYKEKLSVKTIAGIVLILVGCVIILDPQGVIDEISAGGSIIGYIGGIMAAVGFGTEGIFASRAIDVTDSDSSVIVKYISESIMWICIVFPLSFVLFPGFGDLLVSTVTSFDFMFWMVIAALSLGMCYVAMYKCYPLIGVGRTVSFTAFYVPVSIVALTIFLGQSISMFIIVGAIIAIIGMFVMYWEKDSMADSMREGGE